MSTTTSEPKKRFYPIQPATIQLGKVLEATDKNGKPYRKALDSVVTFFDKHGMAKEPVTRTVMAFPHALAALDTQIVSGGTLFAAARFDGGSVLLIGEVREKVPKAA